MQRIESVTKHLENLGIISYTSSESKDHLVKLETEKIHLLRQKEETWRVKSGVIWLKVGDENSKFFQQYAMGRKIINTIWSMWDQTRREAKTFNHLADMGIRHFSHIFKAPREASIPEIFRTTKVFPRFVEVEDAETLNEPLTLSEIEVVLKWFKRDKCLRPYAWPMEFYLTFFYHIGPDLLLAIEGCRLFGWMYAGFN